jgi:manganese efflux pump family protein
VLEVVTLSIALAMDATAVAAARGLAAGRVVRRDALMLPGLFGGFQAGMAAIGWLAGRWIGPTIERWDHWIAFVLLTGLGVKMIVEAVRTDRAAEVADPDPGSDLWTAVGLALATSIDAAAAGVTLPLLSAPPAVALAMIGVVTALLSALGLYAGTRAGRHLGPRLEVLGGVTLIGIAVKLLVDHVA